MESAALPESIRSLPAAALERLGRFRAAALAEGVPGADVDRWIALARPAAELTPGGEGPVVGRCGGPLMLPPDMATPAERYGSPGGDGFESSEHQLIATLDLAAIPVGATDLPLPPDGHLLLFANPDLEPEPAGGALYLPAGTAVEERATNLDWDPVYEHGSPEDLDAHLRAMGELRLRCGATLFEHPVHNLGAYADPGEHPRARALLEVWEEVAYGDDQEGFVEFRVGGYASDFDGYGDPVGYAARLEREAGVSSDAAAGEWVLLAEWHGLPMATVYWVMPRGDLVERRFDRVAVMMWANP
nr:DUF1963 domain-containing protein [Glycomyces amatae]